MGKKLLKYIKGRGLTITQAATILGITRQRLSGIANGQACGRKLAKRIEIWSEGHIYHSYLLYPEDNEGNNGTTKKGKS